MSVWTAAHSLPWSRKQLLRSMSNENGWNVLSDKLVTSTTDTPASFSLLGLGKFDLSESRQMEADLGTSVRMTRVQGVTE